MVSPINPEPADPRLGVWPCGLVSEHKRNLGPEEALGASWDLPEEVEVPGLRSSICLPFPSDSQEPGEGKDRRSWPDHA